MKVTKFDVILNIWVCIVICAVLSFALPMIAKGTITLPEYLSGFIVSTILSFILIMFLPIIKLGDSFAAKCGAEAHTVKRQLLTTIILALIMGTIMSIAMTWWGLRNVPGYQEFFWMAWFAAFPWALLIIYASANVALWTGIPLTKKIMGIPSGPPPDNQAE